MFRKLLTTVVALSAGLVACEDTQRRPEMASGPPGFQLPDARVFFDMAIPDGGVGFEGDQGAGAIEDAEALAEQHAFGVLHAEQRRAARRERYYSRTAGT